ncbi:trans-Golgi network-localized SYP41-interacting protein 1 isoform X2 [Cornus florida]|uniref:trans-Golgi network-localized SYP41-interacting protein 1 isoform X2 n=1 Tax=Cornus florida TaxID=4283 RepID=UPI00289DF7AE|nr:trans-Golgi network-localized SYP41-interacting protein 1 isoform X2 [Cornus florida]
MEKNKNRSDLLAAGRKKLQQFRQKKDGKGSKSSGKAGKSERDVDAGAGTAVAKPAAVSLQVPDVEISSVSASHARVVDSSASHSMENSVTTDADAGTVDPSSVPVVPKTGIVESSLANNVEAPLEHNGVGETVLKPSVGEEQHVDSLVTNESESSCTVDPKNTTGFTHVGILETIVSEEESLHVDSPVAVDLLAPLDLVDAVKLDTNAVETECAEGEDQEADLSGSKPVGQSTGIELELDGSLALSGFGEYAETHAGTTSAETGLKEATLVAEQTHKLDVSASSGATNEVGGQGIDGHSPQPLPESDGSAAVIPDPTDQQSADVVAASRNEEKSEMPSTSNDFGSYCTERVQADKQDNTVDAKQLISKGQSQEWPLDSKMVRLSSGADVSSITLSQLAEVIRGLDENELRFLLTSRELSTNAELMNAACSIEPEYDLCNDLERLKEQLYLTSFAKDVFYLQLHEQAELQTEFDHQHHQLVDEVSIANASLNEVRGRNESLVGELTQCRSELQAVAYVRDEFQKQFHTSQAEVEEFSARVDELNIKLEKSQGDLSSLSGELASCRGLLAALEVENEKLNGRLTSLTDEKLKLEEEKGQFVVENEKLLTDLTECKGSLMLFEVQNVNLKESLALMTAERTKLEEEKEFVVSENWKLVTDLADCKGLMEALQVEHTNLNGVLSSVTEEREKLGEEKEYFARETEKMSTELTDCQSLVEALQVEITELNGSLTSVMEERNKLGEEKEHFVIENKKLLEELASCKCSMEGLQVRHSNAVDDLKEATVHLEQLTEKNVSLNSSLDVHKAKIKEFEDGRNELLSQSGEAGNQVEGSDMPSRGQDSATEDDEAHRIPGKGELFDGLADRSPLKHLELNAYDDSFRFVVLKGHSEEAEEIMQKLEKAIDGLHSHSVFLSRSSDKAVAPGVSKLIQAFESKVHLDDLEVEEVASTENESPADLFMLAKEQTGNLRAVLKELGLDADNASELFKKERDSRILADDAFRELSVTHEALKGQNNVLEAANVELVVLYEIIKQHVCDIEAKKGEFLLLSDAVNQQAIILEAQNSESGKRLSEYQSVVSDLQRRLNEMHLSSNETSSSIYNQLENLHEEVAERTSILEQEWNSTVAEVVQSTGKLDALVGSLFSSTFSTSTQDDLDISSRVAASVDAATKLIKHLHEKISAAGTDHEAICSSYKELTEKFNDLHGKNELAIGVLHKIFGNLTKLVNDSCVSIEPSEEELLDPLHPSNYDTLMEKLGRFLCERLQLVSENNRLNSELMDRAKDIEEHKKSCLDLDAILKLVEDVEGVAELALIEKSEIDPDKPTSSLESVVSFLVQKYKEADEKFGLSRQRYDVKEAEVTELKGQIDQLSFLILQHENEILILKESLSQAEKELVALHSELREKVTEIEQSEQRVSSLREKLSIAVSKGKGLVVQRDSLKQSLAETSFELEKCLQEAQLKDARLREVETKLKTYSEAGERMEALESELSYIRNSATALRESFLLKDSVLQRIEEVLEDLELPEHFHSKDIIEKVDWLARTVTGNSLPLADWDQKSSVGGSYTDAGFVVMDAWKEDVHPNSTSGDDLRRKYEELQSKFYGLAEQNEMLEQSLMERNSLVQRWEECLDRINMPTQLRSMEPEDRIEWLSSALFEAHQHCNSLQQNIDNFEKSCGSLTADLEESQTKISNLEAALQDVLSEKEHLFENLEALTHDYDKISEKAVQFELEKDKLQNELTGMQDKLADKVMTEDCIYRVEDEIRRLQNLISHVLQDSGTEDVVSGGSSIECLEGLLRKLIEKYTALSLENPVLGDAVDEHITEKANVTHDEKRMVDSGDAVEGDIAVLKKELEDALGDLMCVKEERDRYMENNQYLVHEVEALNMRRQELQELLNLEEQKSASVREKLNVAVRKGKSLVQQRDSLKQIIEEANVEMERLKSEINSRENTLLEYKQKIKDLSTYQERVEALESESVFLRDRLAETEYSLQEKGHALSMIMNTLCDVDVGYEFNISDPVKKLEHIGKLCRDLHSAVASSENDSRKSKRAAELLLAELNEVQERNDGLLEELSKAVSELSELSKERDSAEAAKFEALSRLEKLSSVHSDKRNNQFAELMLLKSGVDQLTKGFFDVNNLLGDVFSKDLEFLHNLEVGIKSCLKASDTPNMTGLPFGGALGSIKSPNSESKENFLGSDSVFDSKMQLHFDDNLVVEICSLVGCKLQEFTMEIDALKEKLHTHSVSLHVEAKCLSEVVGTVFREIKSQKQSCETMKENIIRLEHIEKEKSAEIVVMRRNISLLYEACTNSVMQIENWKVQMIENGLAAADQGIHLDPSSVDGGNLFSGLSLSSSEECIQTMVNRLLSVVKDSIRMQSEIVAGGQKELKITISNLQKELWEKDIQKDRICVELVSQIKEAESAARSYLQDLQSEKGQVHDLERKVELMEEEHNMLEHRVKELQFGEATSKDLQERVRSLTDLLAAKEQEIESLMHALDEEETQMEDLTSKIAELERVVQQKNLDLESAEASRGKAMKKLSITVSKFDELHHFSTSLLSEVEKLQSQLQERDAEVSFLRQEVTRCTNDALVASQMNSKRNAAEVHDLLSWLNTTFSQVDNAQFDDKKNDQVDEFEILQRQIMSTISELEDLRVAAQSRDTLLQVERSRVEELLCKEEFLKKSLHEKESQLSMLQGVGDSGQATGMTSEIVEVEPINKWAVPGTSSAPQVRSLRKVNNDQVAVAIDMEPDSGYRLDDEDDDKAHGFKSLTTSRIVPRFTRPLSDMIDGLWVSCDRALMRQPALRLGVIIYWAVIHALIATYVV